MLNLLSVGLWCHRSHGREASPALVLGTDSSWWRHHPGPLGLQSLWSAVSRINRWWRAASLCSSGEAAAQPTGSGNACLALPFRPGGQQATGPCQPRGVPIPVSAFVCGQPLIPPPHSPRWDAFGCLLKPCRACSPVSRVDSSSRPRGRWGGLPVLLSHPVRVPVSLLGWALLYHQCIKSLLVKLMFSCHICWAYLPRFVFLLIFFAWRCSHFYILIQSIGSPPPSNVKVSFTSRELLNNWLYFLLVFKWLFSLTY